jgi:hypothetical protein
VGRRKKKQGPLTSGERPFSVLARSTLFGALKQGSSKQLAGDEMDGYSFDTTSRSRHPILTLALGNYRRKKTIASNYRDRLT